MFVYFLLGTFLGLAIGAGAGAFFMLRLQRNNEAQMRDSFRSLATQQMEENNRNFLQLAQEKLSQQTQSNVQELDGKKALIDQNLVTLKTEVGAKMEQVTALMQQLEKDRESKYSTLAQQLQQAGEHLNKLNLTTADLTAALSNSRKRGEWGERMAEDVLRLAGLQQGLNYRKQQVLTSADGSRPRPDFTFLLPDARVMHMDVKFPMDDYARWHRATEEAERADAARKFVAATKTHIRTTSAREYRSAATGAGETTLDYLLIFIPNDQIYSFLLENAPDTLSDALSQKVILCSPSTLLAVLAVIHQSMQSFALNQQAQAVYSLLTGIRDQWTKFSTHMDKMGERINDAQKLFNELTTTRTNQLDRQFNKLDNLSVTDDAATKQPALLGTTTPESKLFQ